jgi:long-chain acyl-CoA synthetase
MGIAAETIAPRAVDAATIAQAFRMTAAGRPDEIAFRTRNDEISITWGEARERVDTLAGRLAGIGVQRGDIVAIMLANRPEFHICDLAVLMTGATPFSVYQTSPPNQIEYIVSDAGAHVMITEQQFLPRVLAARANLPELHKVIVIDGTADAGVLHIDDLPAPDPAFDVEASAAAIEPEDLLTLIYTSGTTGPPKGVEITHRSFFAYSSGLLDNVPALQPGSHVVSWLPNAHIAERNAHHYLPIVCGMHVTCCPDGREVLDYVAEVRPSWFFAVPRIWEKLRTRAEALLASAPMYAPASLNDAVEKVRLEQRGEQIPDTLAARVAEADERTFFSVRGALGLDRANCHIGAAPAAPDLIEFFQAIGIGLSEIYGMSETTGAGTMNPPESPRIGSAGKPVRDLEMKLADPRPGPGDDARIPQPAGGDGRLLYRRRLVSDRRRRRVRRRRVSANRRSQEGADHQRRRQEHVAGKHRVHAQEREPTDRADVRDRRPPSLQHCFDRPRPRVHARLGGAARRRRAYTGAPRRP